MYQTEVKVSIRSGGDKVSILDVEGGVTASAEGALMDAYAQAIADDSRNIIFNFSNLGYLNSSGVGLLVTLLIRANRQDQRLFAYGLREHFYHVFELTRLNETIRIFDTEAEALAAAFQ